MSECYTYISTLNIYISKACTIIYTNIYTNVTDEETEVKKVKELVPRLVSGRQVVDSKTLISMLLTTTIPHFSSCYYSACKYYKYTCTNAQVHIYKPFHCSRVCSLKD